MGLTLTRKDGELVILKLPDGSRIKIRVWECLKGHTRLVIDAPESVKIWREEILGTESGAAE